MGKWCPEAARKVVSPWFTTWHSFLFFMQWYSHFAFRLDLPFWVQPWFSKFVSRLYTPILLSRLYFFPDMTFLCFAQTWHLYSVSRHCLPFSDQTYPSYFVSRLYFPISFLDLTFLPWIQSIHSYLVRRLDLPISCPDLTFLSSVATLVSTPKLAPPQVFTCGREILMVEKYLEREILMICWTRRVFRLRAAHL